MPISDASYFCGRSERGIFSEIYFPKRAAYYGVIFDALRFGFDENIVKRYLIDNIDNLMNELKSFPDLFDPHRFTTTKLRETPVSREEALERIGMYTSVFKGWSVYSVDGVWFDEEKESETYGKPIKEATQIVRIMFRFNSDFTQEANEKDCFDVLRAIIYWVVGQRGHLKEYKAWSKEGKDQFMKWHDAWFKQEKRKMTFAKQHYSAIAAETIKWVDDRALFVFGYLVRKFWQRVLKEKIKESQIWVTNFFDMVLNVVEKFPQPTPNP